MKEPTTTINSERLRRYELPMGVLGIDLHADECRAFAACVDGVYELNLESGHSKRLYTHESYASGVVCLTEHDKLISAGYDGALQWFDLREGTVVRHVQAHSFWSWDLALAKNAPVLASVSGQYLAGSYEYHPKPTEEPCVRVYDAVDGALICSYQHGPPTQAVALSDNGAYVAAGNLMGDVAVWHVGGERIADWNTPDFTGFGIIKSHCQIGGVYAAAFGPDESLLVAGMGPMRDPMAGNGKQRWQQFAWGCKGPRKIAEAKQDQVGEGLMETLAVHPEGRYFAMGGRLRGGSWNVALFDLASGDLVHSLKTDTRVTQAVFSRDGTKLALAGAKKQSGDAKKTFGVIDLYQLSLSPEQAG